MKYIKDTIKRYIHTYRCNKVKNTIKAGNAFCSPDFFEYIVNKCLLNVRLYLDKIINKLYIIIERTTKDEQFNQIYELIKHYFVVSGYFYPTKEVGFDEANICQRKRNFNLITTEIINSCDNEYDELLMNEHLIHIQLYIAKLYATIIQEIIDTDTKVNLLLALMQEDIIKSYIMKDYKARIQIMHKNYGKKNKNSPKRINT